MKKGYITLFALSICCFAISGFLIWKGFDYKDNYRNSEDYFSTSVNAYVGGDAYNYIINGTYFTGFMVLAGASSMCGAIALGTGLVCRSLENMVNTGENKTQTAGEEM